MRRPISSALLVVAAAAALLCGLIYAGQYLRGRLVDDNRYQFPVSQIDCPGPPGLIRDAFLSEVRYGSDLPDEVSLLDVDLPRRLSAAFARHPWVESVDKVEIGPGRAIRVRLTFRTPVLAVTYEDDGPRTRLVDGHGVLLPPLVAPDTLLHYRGQANPPRKGAGRPWSDLNVEAAARVAQVVHPHQAQLRLAWIVTRENEVFLRGKDLKKGAMVIWGHAPGEEVDGELSAAQKLERLLEYCRLHGRLDRPEDMAHDFRPASKR